MNASAKTARISLRLPVEHGAWGILLVPFVSAAGVAGAWNLPVMLAGGCALGLFLLRGPIEAQASVARPGTSAHAWKMWLKPGHLALAGSSAVAGALLIFLYRREQLLWLGLIAIALYLVQRRLVQLHGAERAEKRSLRAELVGVVLLTLTAPAAWMAARGALDAAGAKVWLLNLLFFLGGVLYIKYRVRGLLVHRSFRSAGERLAFAWPVLLYHLLVAAFLFCCVILGLQPAAVLLAFVPGILRANGLVFHLGRRFAIPRLGWNEILHSVLFAALLIFALRSAA